MDVLIGVMLWLALSVCVSIAFGWMGAYDYTPDYRQVKPTTAKYTMIIIWPFIAIILIGGYLWRFIKFAFGWLDRIFNKAARVR